MTLRVSQSQKKPVILAVHWESHSFKTTVNSYCIHYVHEFYLALCLQHSFSFLLKLMLCWTFRMLGRRQRRLS